MSLSPGQRLAHFEILAPIGAGGMGEVYKAKDTRLARTVAIKVLPEHLAGSHERKARLHREAKAISQLNHPHICTLYDVGEQDGIDFIVMEYIEGETLADRLARGRLKLNQALDYGIQIADGLDKAHRAGIIHRDLKPGNVMLMKSGVKLLDFGLARLLEGDDDSDTSDAPTRQKDLTAEEAIVGTLQYMAPEQLERKAADARTDIFAFGAVLYEMVTGKKAFVGESQASLISAIMSSEPRPTSELRPSPKSLDRIVRACLEKDLEVRWQSVADVKRQLEWVGLKNEGDKGIPRGRLATILWLLAALMGTLAVLLFLGRAGPAASKEPLHVSVSLPDHLELENDVQSMFGAPIALSPDGGTLALTAGAPGHSQLYLREMTGFEVKPVPDTEGATSPFFSPDSEWVGFHAGGKLRKVPRAGGPVETICEAPLYTGLGVDWGTDGTIVFSWTTFSGLYRVSASGGTAKPITQPRVGERGHEFPEFLPDGRSILFSVWGPDATGVLSLDTGDWKTLPIESGGASYVNTGHLVFTEEPGFTTEARLMAVPFDLTALEITGDPVPVLDGVDFRTRSGRASFDVSSSGRLAYVPARDDVRRLVWVDRRGVATRITEEPAPYQFPHLSPDAGRVAFQLDDVWILDLSRGARTRETAGGFPNNPTWSPDGRRLVYSWNRGPWNMFQKMVDASGGGELLLESERSQFPESWSPDGRILAFHEAHPETGRDIWLLPEDGEPEPFLVTGFDERFARFSPDGRFLAYVSNESGRNEVYVQPYPKTGRKWTISTDGGTEPLWARSGRELFYRNGDAVMAVEVRLADELVPGTPRLLFRGAYAYEIFHNYDVSANGQKFLMVENETTPPREVRLIDDWTRTLERATPGDP